MQRRCEFCAKPIKTTPTNGRKKFCDGRCRQAAYNIARLKITCPACGHRLSPQETRDALAHASDRRTGNGDGRPKKRGHR